MNHTHLLATIACLALHGFSAAQSFNVDIETGNGVPSAAFGGAAQQPGIWNAVQAPPSMPNPVALVDVSGVAGSVAIRRTAGNGAGAGFNHPGTTGDDGFLLDDIDDSGGSTTWTISGLAAGSYTVTTYAWAPDSENFFTSVTVDGQLYVVGGAWSGGYTAGTTHAVHTITIAPGGVLAITLQPANLSPFSSFNGVQVHRDDSGATPFCFGDGSGTPCPCGNAGGAGRGCANASFPNGARLTADGQASIANDTFRLTSRELPFGTSTLYFQGTASVQGGNGAAFGDGLRCAGGTVRRLGTISFGMGTTTYPTGSQPSISVQGIVVAGDVRMYQCWYRNATPNFCTPATFNLTNALQITWAP